MKRKFVINIILLILLNLLIKPFWVFFIDRKFQNIVGATEYGLLFSLFNLSVILNTILDLGINNFNNRNISQQPQTINQYFPNIIATKVLLSVIYGIVIILISFLLGYDKSQFWLLMLLALNQFLISMILYLRTNISGLQYYTTDSILSVLDRSIMIVACVFSYFFYFKANGVTLFWFVFIQTLAYLTSLTVISAVLLSKTGKIKMKLQRDLPLKIIKSSLPFALLIFLMSAYSRIDSVMIERMLDNGKEQAGIYAQSFRILDSVVMLPILFAGLLLPMFSKMLATGENISSLVKLSFQIIWVIAVAFALASMFYSKQIIHGLYKEHFDYSAKIFSILILAFIPIAVINIYGTLITASGNLKALNILALISVGLNIVLNLILIPRFEAFGAAISSLTTQLFVSAGQLLLVKRNFGGIYFDWKRLLLFNFLAVIVAVVFFHWFENWFTGFVFMGIFIFLMGMVSGLIPFTEIIAFARKTVSR